ncbi:DUF4153 domain-containing protein [Aminipila butyrica]|uniref:DUF4153 domain-containing protein n=1 Tax=Aminipila butyrica TaxID=433296 RepID=A0A858BVQ5_9FIRM|nr:DUF4153 domain-containing protein [Aminipila butyrica]QIB69667.1 DUF4153 domain-containing protein [Aminipila butyrica]
MHFFTRSMMNLFQGVVRAFIAFPGAILSALAFAVVTMIRIQLNWPQQEPYNFLFNCLHWAFALGAVFSLAAITIAQTRFHKSAFLITNILSAAVVLITFLLLYFFGEGAVSARYTAISSLAAARVNAAILISFIVFIIMAGYPKEQSDFSRSFFMTHKALFIALIYGGVIMAGGSGVAGAVEALLYHDMSGKVYMYIGTIAGFLAFTIFLGYFPDFHKGVVDSHREVAQKQPRFIEALLSYILIPILFALTVVLFLWSGRTILTGTWPSFNQLAGIATAYSAIGLWLHVMVTHHQSGIAGFYRRYYPFAALIILVFEAAAFFVQLGKYGLKVTEYWFMLIWVVAVLAALLLLFLRARSHSLIALFICVITAFSVLPLVGYHSLPVTAQVNRLEKLLTSQGMLENSKLVPAKQEPEKSVREGITDAVYYLASTEDGKRPTWFNNNLDEQDIFETSFGFEPVWPDQEDGTGGYFGTSLYLKADAVDISNYKWGIHLQGEEARVAGEKGAYTIQWKVDSKDSLPFLSIKLNDQVILEDDMSSYIDKITAKFPPGQQSDTREAALDDMSLVLENEEITVLLVFNTVQINVDPVEDHIYYWLDLNTIYLNEK